MTKLVSTYGDVITSGEYCDSNCRWLFEVTLHYANIVQSVGICTLFKREVGLDYRPKGERYFRCDSCKNDFSD